MNKNVKSTQKNKLDSLSTLKLKFKETLTHSTMEKIKGGEGEGNGGVDIIIIPKPKLG